MKKWILIFLLLLTSIVNGYDYVRYVDTGSAGGDGTTAGVVGATAAYTSLSAAETAMDGVVGAGETLIIHCNRTNGGGADTTTFTWSGWNATAVITVTQDDFPTAGGFDNTKYYLHNNDSASYAIIVDGTTQLTFQNFQMMVTCTSTRHGIIVYNQTVASNINFDSMVIKGVCSGTGGAQAIILNNANIVAKIYNCLIYDFAVAADSGFKGIYCDLVNTCDIYNCTIENCTVGIDQDAGTVTATNTIIANSNALWGILDTVTCDYLCDDDNDGTNNQSPAGGDWTTIFNNLAAENYTIKNTGTAYNTGTDNPGSGLYLDDLAGLTRTTTWDIGAFEYDDSPIGGGQESDLVTYGGAKAGGKSAGKNAGKQD